MRCWWSWGVFRVWGGGEGGVSFGFRVRVRVRRVMIMGDFTVRNLQAARPWLSVLWSELVEARGLRVGTVLYGCHWVAPARWCVCFV